MSIGLQLESQLPQRESDGSLHQSLRTQRNPGVDSRGMGISGRSNSRSKKHSHEAASAGNEQVPEEDGREVRLARLARVGAPFPDSHAPATTLLRSHSLVQGPREARILRLMWSDEMEYCHAHSPSLCGAGECNVRVFWGIQKLPGWATTATRGKRNHFWERRVKLPTRYALAF